MRIPFETMHLSTFTSLCILGCVISQVAGFAVPTPSDAYVDTTPTDRGLLILYNKNPTGKNLFTDSSARGFRFGTPPSRGENGETFTEMKFDTCINLKNLGYGGHGEIQWWYKVVYMYCGFFKNQDCAGSSKQPELWGATGGMDMSLADYALGKEVGGDRIYANSVKCSRHRPQAY